jgi:putative membrane protein
LLVREGLPGILRLLELAGWRLVWLVPLHIIPLICYGAAWRSLLPAGHRPGYAYLTWGAIVRESVSGLLPVARVGGEVIGVRLLVRRGVPTAVASASVVVELTLTIAAQVVFTATGLALLAAQSSIGDTGRLVLLGLVASLAALAGFVFVIRRWGERIFALFLGAVQKLTGAADDGATAAGAMRFHQALEGMYADHRALVACGSWQLTGFFLQSVEAYVMLRIVGAPATPRIAIVLESMTNAVQSAMFLVPAGLGTQEGGFLLFGAALGLSSQLALALSLARRVRQLLLGVPALIVWYWTERGLRPSR